MWENPAVTVAALAVVMAALAFIGKLAYDLFTFKRLQNKDAFENAQKRIEELQTQVDVLKKDLDKVNKHMREQDEALFVARRMEQMSLNKYNKLREQTEKLVVRLTKYEAVEGMEY